MGLIIDVRLMMIRRSAPATSAPRPKASRTTAKNAKRNSATENEPMVSRRRAFLRKRLAKISARYFMRHLQRRRLLARRTPPERPFRDAGGGRPAWRQQDPWGPST